MCTLVHHSILKVYCCLPQLSSLWPFSKLTVFHIILLSFKCNAITAEADRMQFSKDLVSFPSLPRRLMCSNDPCFFFFSLSCCKKSKKKSALGSLFALDFGEWSEVERWTYTRMEGLFTTRISNAFICFLTTSISVAFDLKVIQNFF